MSSSGQVDDPSSSDESRVYSTAAAVGVAQSDESRLDPTAAAHESRNFFFLALYFITMRVGWIFKTESIIMPAFLDSISGGAGWIRGCLPLFNRFGQSVPPVLLARRLKITPQKKWPLLGFSLGMAAVFLILAALMFAAGGNKYAWLPAVFLGLYALFFCCAGLAQLSNGTLQGKLVPANRRGRLMFVSITIGVLLAILSAWFLLDRWLALPGGGFGYVFGFTGVLFVLASLCSLGLVEARDDHAEPPVRVHEHFLNAAKILRTDRNFRRLAIVAMLFSTVMILFPHYQALARQRFRFHFNHLMMWVVVQNAGTGIFSLIAGRMADRRGNRIVLRLVMFGHAITPALAVYLSMLSGEGPLWYWVVFVMIGLTPIMFKTMVNYTLEISPRADHPRYLSTLSLCVAAPFCLSPVVGWLVGVLGFEPVLLCGSALITLGGLLTFRLFEPRHVHFAEITEITMDGVDVWRDD